MFIYIWACSPPPALLQETQVSALIDDGARI